MMPQNRWIFASSASLWIPRQQWRGDLPEAGASRCFWHYPRAKWPLADTAGGAELGPLLALDYRLTRKWPRRRFAGWPPSPWRAGPSGALWCGIGWAK